MKALRLVLVLSLGAGACASDDHQVDAGTATDDGSNDLDAYKRRAMEPLTLVRDGGLSEKQVQEIREELERNKMHPGPRR